MCVSALIVLGDKIRHKIDEQFQEQWLMSYIGEYCSLRCKITLAIPRFLVEILICTEEGLI